MDESLQPDALEQHERDLVAQLNGSLSVRTRATLLRLALNNQLGVNERILAALDWQGLDHLYTILAQAADELMEQVRKQQLQVAEQFDARLERLPASTLLSGDDEDHEQQERAEAEAQTTALALLLGDVHRTLNPVVKKPKP